MDHYEGQYYHVFNRGANREPIFACQENYIFLLRQIKHFLPDHPLTMIAYCLMPNHYHFLIRVENDNALSPFIQRLFNSYSQAYNRQQNRSGTLFEGRVKSKLVERDGYLIHIARYIHLNPVQAGLVENPEDWPYSNYREWIGLRKGALFDSEFVYEIFSSSKDYRVFVRSEVPSTIQKKLVDYYLE